MATTLAHESPCDPPKMGYGGKVKRSLVLLDLLEAWETINLKHLLNDDAYEKSHEHDVAMWHIKYYTDTIIEAQKWEQWQQEKEIEQWLA